MLGRLPGVRNVKADHKTQKVRLALEKERTSAGQVIEKLEFLGYSVLPWKDKAGKQSP